MGFTLTEDEYEGMRVDLFRRIESGEFPAVVYKFRCWDDEPYDHIVRHKTISLTKPSKLMADYEEVYLPIDESQITEENLERVALHRAKEIYPNIEPPILYVIAQKLRNEMLIEDPEHRAESEKWAKDRNDELLGIFCTSINSLSLKMWERFSCLGEGFCVGINLHELLMDKRILGSGGYVKYYPRDNPPLLDPFSFTFEERVLKATNRILNIPDAYDYEEEFRISSMNKVIDKNGNYTIRPYTKDERIIEISENHINQILVGYNFDETHLNDFVQLCKQNYPNVPIYRTKELNGLVELDAKI